MEDAAASSGVWAGPRLLAVLARLAAAPASALDSSSPAQICGWASSISPPPGRRKAGSAGLKQVVNGRGKGQVLLHAFRLPPPQWMRLRWPGVPGALSAHGLRGTALGSKSPGLAFLLCCCCLNTKHVEFFRPHGLSCGLLCPWISEQEYWCGFAFPTQGMLPDPGVEPRSHHLQVDSLALSQQEAHPSSYPPVSVTLKGLLIPTTDCRLLL